MHAQISINERAGNLQWSKKDITHILMPSLELGINNSFQHWRSISVTARCLAQLVLRSASAMSRYLRR
jgi:hypothetical protein